MEMEKGAFHQMGSFPELPCYIIYKITALNLPSVCCEQCIFILYLKMNDFAKICTKCKIRQIVVKLRQGSGKDGQGLVNKWPLMAPNGLKGLSTLAKSLH